MQSENHKLPIYCIFYLAHGSCRFNSNVRKYYYEIVYSYFYGNEIKCSK